MPNRCGCDHGPWSQQDLRALCTELSCGCSYDEKAPQKDSFSKERDDYNAKVSELGRNS